MNNEYKLKPCAHCYGSNLVFSKGDCPQIRCLDCGVAFFSFRVNPWMSIEDFIKVWNTRKRRSLNKNEKDNKKIRSK